MLEVIYHAAPLSRDRERQPGPAVLPAGCVSEIDLVAILFVANLFHPGDAVAVERFRDGDMAHRNGSAGPMPVLDARWNPDDVAWPYLLDGAAPMLDAPDACGDDQCLP